MGVTISTTHGGVIDSNHEHSWVHSQPYGPIPPFAVIGGHDCDGAQIYVGRAYHDGDQLPAKVIPSKGCAYVPYGGLEHSKHNYEILVGQGYAWVQCYGGQVPPNAVRSGFTRGGEPLYVGRGHHASSLCVGKIHSSHGCLYIPFGGMEVRLNTYEVLIRQRQDNWVPCTPQFVPPGAIVAGHDSDGDVIYLGRAMHNGEMLPAKVIPSKGTAYVCFGGQEYQKHQFEVLCGHGYIWVKSYNGSMPPNVVSTGRAHDGKPTYVGRGHYQGSLTPGIVFAGQGRLYIPYDTYKWMHSSAYSSVPPDAVVGGNDTDGAIMYVGRAFHNGDALVAKVLPTKHIAFVSWRGEEIPKEHFEILCGKNLVWRHCYNHIIPENAILCGETSLGQPVYIGRGHYNGSLTIGKISSVHRALFIPYHGEKRLESYEILLHEKGQTPGWAIPAELEEKKPLPAIEEDYGFLPPPPPPPYIPTAAVEPPPPYAALTYTPYETKPAYVPNYATPYETKPAYVPNYATPYETDLRPPQLIRKAGTYNPPPKTIVMPAETYKPSSMTSCGIIPADTYRPQKAPSFGMVPAETYTPPLAAFSEHDLWIQSNDNYVPPNAFRAGQDTDLSSLYICRAFHNGNMIPGKTNPSHRCAYICCDGQEIRKNNFEILIGDKYRWVPAHNGNVPSPAVEGGRTASGEILYIARAHYNESLTPGKLHPSHGCAYIPFGGREIRLTNYEVLVRW